MSNFSPKTGMTPDQIDQCVSAILAEATLEEKVGMMSGKGFFEQYGKTKQWGAEPYRAGAGCERLGVPALYFTDGPRGVARGQSTSFPCTMARGASFDTDLERRVGEVMGIETRAQGCNLNGAVCVNLLRHPAWGRAQETYGEDSYHLGKMGSALAVGIQTHGVIATVKHFALNSIENARFKIDVQLDERALHEVYLPHFKRILDAGCASVMSAYNKMNGEYCGQNRRLLTDILRHEWGFDGFVHSDWIMGVYHPYGAAAGLDIENPEPIHFGQKLIDAVNNGQIGTEIVDTAVRRILSTLYRFECAERPLETYDASLVASEDHRMLSREVAEKTAVLLRNESMLPLKPDETKSLAVFGELAKLENTGDNGSSRVNAEYVVTPFEGLSAYLGEAHVSYGGGETDVSAAAKAAADADASIIVVGYTADQEGEFIPGDLTLGQDAVFASDGEGGSNRAPIGGDRTDLGLPADQVTLIKAVCAANPRAIVVVVAGSAVMMADWFEAPGAVLQTFYAGMEGGRALARLVFGDVSPSAKLPFTVPSAADDLPFFDKDADEIEYGYYHGYLLMDRDGKTPALPFGFGLSYAAFAYRALRLRHLSDGNVEVQVSVRNTGDCRAAEIVQVYASAPGVAVDRPRKTLCGFQRVELAPGETKTLRLEIDAQDLRYYDPASKTWRTEQGAHVFRVGGTSDEAGHITAALNL